MAELNGDFVASVPIEKLKENPFAKELFADLKGEDYKMLKKDVEKNGIRLPLEVLADFTLIDGHQRLKIARELAMTHVPCLIKKLSDFDAKVWVITANLARRQLKPEERAIPIAKLSELYENPTGADHVSQEYQKLKLSSGNVLETTAEKLSLSKGTIQRYRAYAKATEQYPELKGKPIIATLNEAKRREQIQKRKETVIPSSSNLILGDAFEIIGRLPEKSVDVLLTDPPYGIEYCSNHPLIKIQENPIINDNPEIWSKLHSLFLSLWHVLKDDAFLYIFCSWKNYSKLESEISLNYKIKTVIVWDKGNWTGGDLYNNYGESYELIVFALKGNKKMAFDKRPRNLVLCSRPNNDPKRKYHPLEKPVNLLKQLIEHSTVEGETILDCFAGSGSTLIAAEELNRKWIGIEIDEQWYDIAKERLANIVKM